MSKNTIQRILVGAIMALVAGGAAALEYFLDFPAVRILGIIIVLMMILEMILCIKKTKQSLLSKGGIVYMVFLAWLFVMLAAINAVGSYPKIILQLLLIISAADIGAWFFGSILGGDKMWERISAHKTWAGQIAGVICGAVVFVAYAMLVGQPFSVAFGMIWTGISVALLSQYGDLTASWIKRKMGIKDFGNILPGHGGMLDRFDGWIYALPLVWLTML